MTTPTPSPTRSTLSVGGAAVGRGAENAAAAGIEAAVAASASPVAGRVVGHLVRTKRGRRAMRFTIAAIAVLIVLGVCGAMILGIAVVNMVQSIVPKNEGADPTGCYSVQNVDLAGLTAEQQSNAKLIIQAALARTGDLRDAVVAIMVALDESNLVNLAGGDADSVGLFQQRATWGTVAQRTDPATATGMFLDALQTTGPFSQQRADYLDTSKYGPYLNPAGHSRYGLYYPWTVAQLVQGSYADGQYQPGGVDRFAPGVEELGENYRAEYPAALALVSQATGATVADWSGTITDLQPGQAGPAGLTGLDGNPIGGSLVGSDPAFNAGLANAPVLQCNGTVGGANPAGLDATAMAWGGYSNGKIPLSALMQIPWAPGQYARADAVGALISLNDAYKAKFGTDIAITDSYRSYAEQVATKAAKGHMAATPGFSNHGWGLALDLGGGINVFGSPEHEWMYQMAPSYGWVNPTWAQPGNGKEEPWHFEFVNGQTAG